VESSGSWLAEARRVFLLVALAALIGWLVGKTLLFIVAVLALVQLYWLFQLRRIQGWLAAPEEEPPESFGIWGGIFDQIYNIQRRNTEAHTRLQFTVDHLRDSFASMRDGAVMLDAGGTIDWSNAGAEKLLGLQYPADKGQGILDLVRAPEFHQYFLAGNYENPLQLQASGEQELHLRIEITCFGDGDRLIFIRDVTKIRRLEQMRKVFVSNVSHELRTPLTVISGYVATLLSTSDSLDPRFRKPLQQMEQQAQRMESLLKDLLWLSRVEHISSFDKSEMVDIQGLLLDLRDELQANYPGRIIELEMGTEHKVAGDYRELHSAISNLVLNALNYSADDSPVRIAWTQEATDYQLAVIDQGIGIDAVHIPRLTERFYRVSGSRSSATGGTGLGLAIVKHVAASHNAQLRIESVPGQGSNFILVFSL